LQKTAIFGGIFHCPVRNSKFYIDIGVSLHHHHQTNTVFDRERPVTGTFGVCRLMMMLSGSPYFLDVAHFGVEMSDIIDCLLTLVIFA
jgi:hypothetical protein